MRTSRILRQDFLILPSQEEDLDFGSLSFKVLARAPRVIRMATEAAASSSKRHLGYHQYRETTLMKDSRALGLDSSSLGSPMHAISPTCRTTSFGSGCRPLLWSRGPGNRHSGKTPWIPGQFPVMESQEDKQKIQDDKV